jgi:hypothetical protein
LIAQSYRFSIKNPLKPGDSHGLKRVLKFEHIFSRIYYALASLKPNQRGDALCLKAAEHSITSGCHSKNQQVLDPVHFPTHVKDRFNNFVCARRNSRRAILSNGNEVDVLWLKRQMV